MSTDDADGGLQHSPEAAGPVEFLPQLGKEGQRLAMPTILRRQEEGTD